MTEDQFEKWSAKLGKNPDLNRNFQAVLAENPDFNSQVVESMVDSHHRAFDELCEPGFPYLLSAEEVKPWFDLLQSRLKDNPAVAHRWVSWEMNALAGDAEFRELFRSVTVPMAQSIFTPERIRLLIDKIETAQREKSDADPSIWKSSIMPHLLMDKEKGDPEPPPILIELCNVSMLTHVKEWFDGMNN